MYTIGRFSTAIGHFLLNEHAYSQLEPARRDAYSVVCGQMLNDLGVERGILSPSADAPAEVNLPLGLQSGAKCISLPNQRRIILCRK